MKKYYTMYQTYVRFNREEMIMVGRIETENNDPIKKYLEEIHPHGKERQEFIEAYLLCDEISKEHFDKISIDDIESNRKKLGVWI